jgi:hypothetical protein
MTAVCGRELELPPPQAVRRQFRLLARKAPLTLTVEPPCCGPENLGRNRTSAPAPLGR